jgi:hypothetical protein
LRKTTWEVGTELDVHFVIALLSLRANGAHEGLIARSSPMELIETLRNIAIREGFEAGRSIQELSEETGLPVLEVLQREVDLHLIPATEAVARPNRD